MDRIDSLEFLMKFSELQFMNGGVGGFVSVKMIQDNSDLPRSTVYHHIKSLIKRGYLMRRKHGQYCVAFNQSTALFGANVVTVWDTIEINNNLDSWLSQFVNK